jgi:hypothetical protein
MVLDQLSMAQIEGLDDGEIDPKELSSVVDRLQLKFCRVVSQARERGEHRVFSPNISAVGWVAGICSMSRTSAADRLCVGKQIESLPKVAEALRAGEIGYQPVAVICHLNEQLAEKGDRVVEEDWVDYARKFSVKELRDLAAITRHVVDPDGFLKDANEDFEERRLHISQTGAMFVINGVLDPEGGAALKTAIDTLSKRHAPDDERTPRQRRADALTEIVVHAMDEGKLPKRNGVRPHITVTTTLEGLKGELGVPASDLEHGMPISSVTVQRLACDGCLSRVLMAESQVIDVGRATRAISPSQKRALRARDKHCRFPGCDRPVSWTNPHHIEFWARGGPTNLPNLISLCWFHHRCVHEGGWQVVKAAQGFRFIAPPHLWGGGAKRRWGRPSWAA